MPAAYPKVSVVIPAGRANPLYKESLARQAYPNYETLAIEGLTTSKARNIGIEKAGGEVVVFIDDDVVLPQDWISKGVSLLEKTGADIIGGPNIGFPDAAISERISDFLISSPLLNGFRRKYRRIEPPGFYNYKNFATCNLMIRRESLKKIGGFNEKYKYVEDMDFLLRCELEGFKKYYSPDLFLYHKRRSFPYPHVKQLFLWGYWNMYLAGQYHIVSERPDIWLSLLSLPIGALGLYFFFKPAVIISLLLFPIALHFLSYSIGVNAGFLANLVRRRKVK